MTDFCNSQQMWGCRIKLIFFSSFRAPTRNLNELPPFLSFLNKGQSEPRAVLVCKPGSVAALMRRSVRGTACGGWF